MRSFRSLLCCSLLLCGAASADAQVNILGRVIEDASQLPVAGVNVQLQTDRGRTLERGVTDAMGRFHFVSTTTTPVRIHAARAGYQATTTPVMRLDGFMTFQVEVRMDVDVVPLAPLEVVARYRMSVGPTLAGFEHRRQGGMGIFLTREQIEQRSQGEVTDILATLPGVWLQRSATGNRRIVHMARALQCPAQIFVDGFHVNRSGRQAPGRMGRSTAMTDAFPIDDLVKPGTVHGIEVYQGVSNIPAEFRTADAECGVVAIWTRREG
jgi:hypothetical protein